MTSLFTLCIEYIDKFGCVEIGSNGLSPCILIYKLDNEIEFAGIRALNDDLEFTTAFVIMSIYGYM